MKAMKAPGFFLAFFLAFSLTNNIAYVKLKVISSTKIWGTGFFGYPFHIIASEPNQAVYFCLHGSDCRASPILNN
jgi:hypothetical protein